MKRKNIYRTHKLRRRQAWLIPLQISRLSITVTLILQVPRFTNTIPEAISLQRTSFLHSKDSEKKLIILCCGHKSDISQVVFKSEWHRSKSRVPSVAVTLILRVARFTNTIPEAILLQRTSFLLSKDSEKKWWYIVDISQTVFKPGWHRSKCRAPSVAVAALTPALCCATCNQPTTTPAAKRGRAHWWNDTVQRVMSP